MPHPIHHLHKRKRTHLQGEPYPHPQTMKRFLDHAVYVVGTLGPIIGSLQAYKIWHEQTAAGISLAMFSFNIINNIVWFSYGIIHREKPIMIMYTLWFIVNCAIVSGTLMYR